MFYSAFQLTKFPLHSCEVYNECSTCVSSRDPLGCGWCGSKCTKRDECNETAMAWSHDTCKPYISSVSIRYHNGLKY